MNVIKAKSEDEAKSKFTSLWDEKSSGHLPSPKLEIVSVEKADNKGTDKTIHIF